MLEDCRRGVVGRVARGAALAGAMALPLLAPGCEKETERPGFVNDCNDPSCLEVRGGGVPIPVGVGGPGGAGEAGAAGSGGMPGTGTGTLAGSVLEVASTDLTTSRSLQGEVEVRATSTDPGAEPVVTQPGADGTYRLEGVAVASVVWVGVGAFADPPSEPFIDTLQAVDSTRADFVNLLVFRRDTLREVFAASFINTPLELDPTLAQVVLRFVDEDGVPVEGVQITFPAPDEIATAYDAGEIFSDALEETSTGGMAVLANLAAPAYPGGQTSIVANFDGLQLTAQIQVARGAVTVVDAVVPAP